MEAVAGAAGCLGAVHRRVGLPGQAVGRLAGLGRERDAKAGAKLDHEAAELERLAEARQDLFGDPGGVGLALQALEQDRELVAAEPRHRVGAPDHAQQALGDRGQQPVAGGVAIAVVDRLEAVEIEEDDRDQLPRRVSDLRAIEPPQRPGQAVVEQRPVGQAGRAWPGTGLVSLGTSGVVFAPSAGLEIDPDGALHAFCHAVPGQYHLTGMVLSAAGSLRWFRDVLGAPAGAGRGDPYADLTAAAAEVAPGAEGLFFLPYLTGERSPHMDPYARAAWIGLTFAHDRRHLVRALLEGVSFALKDSLVLMRRLGVAPDRLHAVGGGARSPAWRQILAAVLGLPLQRLAIEEGPALGAALLAAVVAGVHADVDAAVAAVVRPEGAADAPDAGPCALYDELYRDFSRLYPALKQTGLWRERA